ncbi:MAG: ATP-binding protein [Candidatus Dormiibacterota bacterium]
MSAFTPGTTTFPDPGGLLRALGLCTTEADLAQVLYARLSPLFGYDVVALHVLERDGWCNRIVIDQGVLQDLRRFRVRDSYFAEHYRAEVIAAGHFEEPHVEQGRGPGSPERPRTFIWAPIHHRRQLVGAVIYQMNEWRLVDDDEIAFLDGLHAHMGALVMSAYLHALTRNQALSLGALNDVGRALAATHDEESVVAGLLATVGSRVGVDALQLVVPDVERQRARVVRMPPSSTPGARTVPLRSREMTRVRRVLASRKPMRLHGSDAGGGADAYVPIAGDDGVDAVLIAHSDSPDAYEDSTVAFLLQVADHVALALHNAWSLAAREEQRQRLEVVAAVGRRLAGAVDRPSIVRELNAELSEHLAFDVFALAVVERRSQGLVAETYAVDHGVMQPPTAVFMRPHDPAFDAVETGRPVLLQGAALRPGTDRDTGVLGRRRGRRTPRSVLWVPVVSQGQVRCLMSLQSYASGAFDRSQVSVVEDLGGNLRLALSTADMFTRMRAILEYSPVGVALEDRAGEIAFVNPALEHIYGMPVEGLLGQPLRRVLDAVGATPVDDDDDDTKRLGTRYRLASRDIVVEVRSVVIPGAADQSSGVLTLHEDVTQEQTLQEGKDLMLRAIGHEVRSPAAAIRTTLAALVEWLPSMSGEQQRALLEGAYEQSERLLRLTEAQLMIAKLEQGAFTPEAVPIDLAETVDRIRRLLAHRYGDRANAVELKAPPGLPDALAVPAHLDEVITNLVGNALEHTTGGAVTIRARSEGTWLVVEVADNGSGLPAHRIKRLFERGGRPGSHRARGGLGLGLYLCRLIVERSFGGTIEVSRTGQDGTTIRFTVPARRLARRLVAEAGGG